MHRATSLSRSSSGEDSKPARSREESSTVLVSKESIVSESYHSEYHSSTDSDERTKYYKQGVIVANSSSMSTNNDKDTNSIDGRSRSGNNTWQSGNEWQQQQQQQHFLSSYPQQQQQQGSQQQQQQQPTFQYPSLQDQQHQQYQWFTQQQQQTFNPSMSLGTSAFTTTAGLSPWGRSGGSQMGSSMGANAAADDGVGRPGGGGGGGVLRSSSYGGVSGPAETVKQQSQQQQPKVDAQGFPLQSTPITTAERMRGSGMQQQVGMTPSPYTTSVLPSSFGQHQQSSHPHPAQKKLKSIKEDEEDPAMLRCETRSGFDTSPMVESLALQKKKEDDEGVTFDSSDVEGPTPMPPSRQHRRISSLGQNLSFPSLPKDTPGVSAASTSSFPGGQLQRGPSNNDQNSSIGMLQEFPYLFDGYAAWVCRHCQHVPPYYRGGNYVWQSLQPPPNQFVDMHLRFCPGLNPANMPPPAAMQPHMPFPPMMQQQPQTPFMQQSQQQMFQQQHQQSLSKPQFDHSQEDEQTGAPPDPPTGTSPQPPRQVSDRERNNDKTGGVIASSEGAQWDFSHGCSSRPPSFQSSYPYNLYPLHNMMQMPTLGDTAVGGMQYPQSMSESSISGSGVASLDLSPPRNAKKRKAAESSKASPMGRHTDDVTYKNAKVFLTKTTRRTALSIPSIEGSDLGQTLVEPSDADLLTDYFFHMLQQLVVCRFSEKDRKTRGGKRENINIGYGGLQCIHCIEALSARKFFWSTVDRLANSFAEIPSHILKCKHCPSDVKDALLALKGRHHDQMQLLPRGSQKVFFRRMWRRLHDRDESSMPSTPIRSHPSSSYPDNERGIDPPPSAVHASPESALPAAASLLAMGQSLPNQDLWSGNKITLEDRQHERVLLAIPEDKNWLSDMDCFVRNNIEIFTAKQIDVDNAVADRKYPIKVGQVGIRCVHCAEASAGAVRNTAVSYPYSISGIYESVREFQRLHLESCPNIPTDIKDASTKLGGGSSSLSSVLRRYYVQAARALGLFDTQDDGIAAGGIPVPLSTVGFQSPAATLTSAIDVPGTLPEDDRKRRSYAVNDNEANFLDETRTKRMKFEDTTGFEPDGFEPEASRQRDAPAKDDIPGKVDAPGAKA